MSLMLGKLYTALKSAGYENRLATIEVTQKLHSWMLGTLLAVCLTILFKVFS